LQTLYLKPLITKKSIRLRQSTVPFARKHLVHSRQLGTTATGVVPVFATSVQRTRNNSARTIRLSIVSATCVSLFERISPS
jgi:hypothetical protein